EDELRGLLPLATPTATARPAPPAAGEVRQAGFYPDREPPPTPGAAPGPRPTSVGPLDGPPDPPPPPTGPTAPAQTSPPTAQGPPQPGPAPQPPAAPVTAASALALEVVGPAQVAPGEPLACTLVVRNTGAAAVAPVRVEVPLPPGLRLLFTEPATESRGDRLA